jgi:hypothetical protein
MKNAVKDDDPCHNVSHKTEYATRRKPGKFIPQPTCLINAADMPPLDDRCRRREALLADHGVPLGAALEEKYELVSPWYVSLATALTIKS